MAVSQEPSRASTPVEQSTTMHLPRILCLHGGGTNASIFRNQMRAFLAHPQLSQRYRFVFAEAPFFCDEGIGVGAVYANWGPFRRWSRWLNTQPGVDASACHHEVMYAIESCMKADEGVGEWVGVLGFSQGAKVACSLLLKRELDKINGTDRASPLDDLKFAIIKAGRAPLMALDDGMEELKFLQSAAGLPDEADMDAIYDFPECKIKLPTVHVHGLRDPGLELHRKCVEQYCAPGTSTVVEWDGPHRVTIKQTDVQRVVDAIVAVADEYGL